jgi:uncharacterized membrane protein
MTSDDRPALLSPWDLLTLAGFAGLLWFWLAIRPGLPDPVPTHWDLRGQVNGWTSRSAMPVLLFGLPLLVWGAFLGTTAVMAGFREDGKPDQALAMRPLRGLMGLGLCLLMATVPLAGSRGQGVIFLGLAGFLALLGLGIALMARTLMRMPRDPRGAEFYRWGVFYVNPEDPRLLVEKRYGIGLTLNFAHRRSWLVLGLALVPVPVLLLVKVLAP